MCFVRPFSVLSAGASADRCCPAPGRGPRPSWRGPGAPGSLDVGDKDRVSTAADAFSDTTAGLHHVAQADENESDLVACDAGLLHEGQLATAGQGCFEAEAAAG